MKVTLESTSMVVDVNNTPVRIWEGTTESGIKVHAFITRIACDPADDQEQFKRELQECVPPSPAIQSFPLRVIL